MAQRARVVPLQRRLRKTTWADPGKVAEAAETMSEEFLLCRTYGHAWRPFGAEDTRDGTVIEILRCLSCKTLASMEVSATSGEQLTDRKYNHAEGYLTKGLGRMGGDARGALRMQLWERQKSAEEPQKRTEKRPRRTSTQRAQ